MSSSKPTVYQRLRYFTTSIDDVDEIDRYLANQDLGVSRERFYAAFTNWCYSNLSRARTSSKEGNQEEQNAVAVLTKYPADTAKFIGLMERYRVTSFKNGLKKGLVDINKPSIAALNEAQTKMYEAAFDKETRRDHAKTKGVDVAYFDKSRKGRSDRKFARRKAARAASGQDGEAEEEDEADEEDPEDPEMQELPIRGGRDTAMD